MEMQTLGCDRCRGKGRVKEPGFDGATMIDCAACTGTGELELTDEEAAILDRFLADCAASLDGAATVADVAAFLSPALPAIAHPGMTPGFFDLAVKRAMDAGLCIQKTARASVVAVSSANDADLSYLVTRTTCGCEGHRRHGRCLHRALAIAWWDVFSRPTPPAAPALVPAA